jgi:hypothetical protein
MLHHAPKRTTGDFQNKKHRFVQKCAKVNGTGPPGSPIKKTHSKCSWSVTTEPKDVSRKGSKKHEPQHITTLWTHLGCFHLFPFCQLDSIGPNARWPTQSWTEDPKQTLGMVFGNLQKELVVYIMPHPGQWSLPGRTKDPNLAEEAQIRIIFFRSWSRDKRELHDMLRRLDSSLYSTNASRGIWDSLSKPRLIMCVLSAASARRHLLIFRRRQDCVGWAASSWLLHLRSKNLRRRSCRRFFWHVHPRRLPSTRRRPVYTLRRYPKLVYTCRT